MNTVVKITDDDDEDVYLTPERVQMDQQTRSDILLNIAGALLLMSIVVLLFFLMSVRSTKIKSADLPDHTFDHINISNFVLNIVSRDEWKAQASKGLHINLTHPIHRILVGHTGFSECREQDMCVQEIQKLQTFYMEVKHVDDIGWNFMIGGDGTVYQGCGWDYEGFHTPGFNNNSLGIGLIGKFSRNSPTQEQLIALHLLVKEGVEIKKLSIDYKLYSQRSFLPRSDSPGKNVIDIIKKWPHFKALSAQ